MAITAAATDIRLEDEMDHVHTIPAGESYMDDSAWLVVGESEGNDILFITCFFRFGGRQPGQSGVWLVDKNCALHTAFLVVPKDQRGKMHDNDFIGNRSFGPEWLKQDVQIVPKEDRVIWQQGKRQHICRPPYWEIKGEHLGVDCNLTVAARSNASWFLGPWKNLTLSGSQAGYELGCWCEGTFTVDGKTYTLEKGYACRERLTVGQTWDLAKLFRREHYSWIWCFSEPVQIFIFNAAFMGYRVGQVLIDGQEVPFEHPQITFDEMDWWIDPKTRMRVPTRWHLNINSENGVADAIVVAHARAFYSYASETGVSIHYEILSRTNGRVFLRDGRSIPINDAVSSVDMGWAAVPLVVGAPVELPLEAPAE